MSSTTEVHPEAVLAALLAKESRAPVPHTLQRINEICRTRYEAGSKDFSIPTIGRLCEQEGLFKGRILYNASSRDYVSLINAWAAYAGPPVAPPPKTLASNQFLMKIENPAIRAIMQSIIGERDKLRAQLNMLKSEKVGKIDIRPSRGSNGQNQAVSYVVEEILEAGSALTDSERQALSKALSPELLDKMDWIEGDRGEIKNRTGRTIFEPGFATAIRKILGGLGPKVKVVN